MEMKTVILASQTRVCFEVCPQCKGDIFIETGVMIGEEMEDGVMPCPLCHEKGIIVSISKPIKNE